jgi:hypothetical protein
MTAEGIDVLAAMLDLHHARERLRGQPVLDDLTGESVAMAPD